MICPLCKNKLKCQRGDLTDNYTYVREYGCARCNKVFMSLETLDEEPTNKEMQKLQREYVLRKLGRGLE